MSRGSRHPDSVKCLALASTKHSIMVLTELGVVSSIQLNPKKNIISLCMAQSGVCLVFAEL